jgi:choline-sulfatase
MGYKHPLGHFLAKLPFFPWGSWNWGNSRKLFWIILSFALYVLPSLMSAESAAKRPIILISVDTLRADRLSCYGYKIRQTPHIDAMADGGTLFSQVNSQVPLTLPSHTSLLTSTFPFSNGVEDNGRLLAPGTLTLASYLKSHGYRTAAFVGGFVLDKRFGLDQGFDVYDSPFNLRRQRRDDPGDVKRTGEEVIKSAIAWLKGAAGSPFFLFLHLYDLHAPYELPPAQILPLGSAGYNKALAYEDQVLGQFWDFLDHEGLASRSLVIFTSDHGESLGEHGEAAHGYFVYQSTLRVPLIFRWPKGTVGVWKRVEVPVNLIDIAPTILQYLGLPIPREFQGKTLLDLMRTQPKGRPGDAYGGSLYARNHFGCVPLRSLRLGRYKYIEAPRPEFYDLSADPGETRNLYSQQVSIARFYRDRLKSLLEKFPLTQSGKSPAQSQEVAAALQSLGYLTSGSSSAPTAEPVADPKDRIADFEENRRAFDLASAGRSSEAGQIFEKLSRKYPEVSDLRVSLAVNQQREGRGKEAIQNFQAALKQDPMNVRAHFDLANAYFETQQLEAASRELEATLAIAPYYNRAAEMLGAILLQNRNYTGARAHFQRMLASDPGNYIANYQLGTMATQEEKWLEAERFFKEAAKADPKSAEVLNGLGVVYMMGSKLEEARTALQEALRLEPKWAEVHFNLGLVYRQQKQLDEAAIEFRNALSVDPQFVRARQALNSPEFRGR